MKRRNFLKGIIGLIGASALPGTIDKVLASTEVPSKDVADLEFTIEKTVVNAKPRKLKARWEIDWDTQEIYKVDAFRHDVGDMWFNSENGETSIFTDQGWKKVEAQ